MTVNILSVFNSKKSQENVFDFSVSVELFLFKEENAQGQQHERLLNDNHHHSLNVFEGTDQSHIC